MLKRLAEVQSMDLEIDSLQEERGKVPPELTEAEEHKSTLDDALHVKTEAREDLRRRVNTNDLELKSIEELRRNASANAVRASTTKEATQFQNQELQFATRIQELEEDTLPLMENFDVVAAEVEALETELAELLPRIEELAEVERQRVEAVDAKAAELTAQREAVATTIDAQLLKVYDQVRRARRGIGLAEVVNNATCSGCNVRLPIHVVQKVRKGGEVTRCPSCGRILMIRE